MAHVGHHELNGRTQLVVVRNAKLPMCAILKCEAMANVGVAYISVAGGARLTSDRRSNLET